MRAHAVAVLTFLAVLSAGTVSAQAHHTDRHDRGPSGRCGTFQVGFVVRGTYDDDRNDVEGDGTYDGELTVDVVRRNRHARRSGVGSGNETFDLDDTKVTFVGYDGNDGFADVEDEDRVLVIGRIGVKKRGCGNGDRRYESDEDATIRKVVVFNR